MFKRRQFLSFLCVRLHSFRQSARDTNQSTVEKKIKSNLNVLLHYVNRRWKNIKLKSGRAVIREILSCLHKTLFSLGEGVGFMRCWTNTMSDFKTEKKKNEKFSGGKRRKVSHTMEIFHPNVKKENMTNLENTIRQLPFFSHFSP